MTLESLVRLHYDFVDFPYNISQRNVNGLKIFFFFCKSNFMFLCLLKFNLQKFKGKELTKILVRKKRTNSKTGEKTTRRRKFNPFLLRANAFDKKTALFHNQKPVR